MSCRFSQWSLLGGCISGVAQPPPDEPAGAHLLQGRPEQPRLQRAPAAGSGRSASGSLGAAAPHTSSCRASSVVGSVVFQAVSVAIEIQTDLHSS